MTEKDNYVEQLADRAEVLGGLTAQVQSKLFGQQRFLGRIEGLLLVLLVAVLYGTWSIREEQRVLDIRLDRLEATYERTSM